MALVAELGMELGAPPASNWHVDRLHTGGVAGDDLHAWDLGHLVAVVLVEAYSSGRAL
jgi:hypothetical protein